MQHSVGTGVVIGLTYGRPWWPGGKVLALGPECSGFETDSFEDPTCIWIWCTLNLTSWSKRSTSGWCKSLEGGTAQLSPSQPDRCSKLRGPSQNSTSIALKAGRY
ncbi:hypothetical protein AVEN_81581-1 [Araneus ventricosus]|uniref:Uncharacterized protein n=1 Tax=Araneus ventricosus TaxID=182803 RepID=A0A4Y2FQL0_ARAVE|nr:hypothetical protein AVEN_81581-1 [Araneus ventricosus]